MTDLDRYVTDPVAFLDDLVTVNEQGQSFRLFEHQREILRQAFTFDAARCLAWDTFVYSCPKKSGKTTINAALTTWWLFNQEPPNEGFILANDAEQAAARTFSTVVRLLQHNPALLDSVVALDAKHVAFSHGSDLRWLASEYAGASGSNHGLTSWDELWGYTSEASRRLWEEMSPVPTRRNSIRIITTYAGFENESELLRGLYLQGVGPEEHPEGQGARIHSTLPLYLNRAARLLVYWDHEPRMPWQTSQYYTPQRQALRPAAYLRLHENRWTTSESIFITPELWDAAVDQEHHPLLPTKDRALFVGVDAGIKHDALAVVAVYRESDWLELALHRIWVPSGMPIDLEETIEAYLLALHSAYQVQQILCDPYQLHHSITTLRAAGLPVEEFPQTQANTVRMGQGLYELLKGVNLRLYPDDALRAQALHTVAIESPRGFRIAKEKASKKIDAIVACSMACVAALDAPKYVPVKLWGG